MDELRNKIIEHANSELKKVKNKESVEKMKKEREARDLAIR